MGLIKAIGALGKTAMKGFEADGLLRKGFESAWDGTVKAGQSILHSNEPLNGIKGMSKSAMESAGKFAQGARNTAEGMMKQAGEKVNQAAAKAGIPDLGVSIQNAGDELGSKIAGMGEGAYNYAQKVAPQAVKAAENVAATGKKLGEEVAENINKKAEEISKKLTINKNQSVNNYINSTINKFFYYREITNFVCEMKSSISLFIL